MCRVRWGLKDNVHKGIVVGFVNYKEQIHAVVMEGTVFNNIPVSWLIFESWTE